MNSVREVRTTEHGNTYEVVTPLHLASERVFDAYAGAVLREFLYRHGCHHEHATDAQLLKRVEMAFRPSS